MDVLPSRVRDLRFSVSIIENRKFQLAASEESSPPSDVKINYLREC